MPGFKKILLVEDDIISAMIATRQIAMNDFAEDVITAENGLIACNKIEKMQAENEPLPGMIFLDLQMGVMNGWEFLEWYNEFTASLQFFPPVYILSSTIDEIDKRRALMYDRVKGFILKPIKPEDLQKILKDNFNAYN